MFSSHTEQHQSETEGNMSKIFGFAVKTIEICPKTEKKKLKMCTYMQNKKHTIVIKATQNIQKST
jgi:hypothetical protein